VQAGQLIAFLNLSLVFGVATQLIGEMARGDQLRTFAERNESNLVV
jgi:hypothetical protein